MPKENVEEPVEVKRPRGRPRKNKEPQEPKIRGRPKKFLSDEERIAHNLEEYQKRKSSGYFHDRYMSKESQTCEICDKTVRNIAMHAKSKYCQVIRKKLNN
jgi:hypothetical protein